MPLFIGRDREARRAYGFDEVAIVPGECTLDPDEIDITTKIGDIELKIPFLASAMDGVVDAKFSAAFSKLGGLAVLNLDGIHSRYENTDEIYKQIAEIPPAEATKFVQQLYRKPVKEELIAKKIKEIKKLKGIAAVSTVPQNAAKYAKIVQDAGADVFVIQATVLTTKFISTKVKTLNLKKLIGELKIPVILGNCVSYQTALALMETGCAGLLVGIGPGSACTTRGVLGIGVPQVTATIDCAAARDFYFKKTGRHVAVITDGGMNTGGDICKAFVSGADAVMIGSAFAKAKEAPGYGYHWGMATPHQYLPRGTRIYVGTTGTLEQILMGPANTDDGTQNIVGALRTCMGSVGAGNVKELQLVELIIAPDIKSEGKLYQKAQKIGMGK
ncbi:MAG: GuaB3 family IMP dehydrogenase-related protein [Elusimicrobiota bacterium]